MKVKEILKSDLILLIPFIGIVYTFYKGFTKGWYTPICRGTIGLTCSISQAIYFSALLFYILLF
jgi:glycopeptide antibiotics resistance protein